MNFCKNCGGKISEKDKFCAICGQAIDRTIEYTVPDKQTQTTTNATQTPSEPKAIADQKYLNTNINDLVKNKINEEFKKIGIESNGTSFNFLLRKRLIYTIITSLINVIVIALLLITRTLIPLYIFILAINMICYIIFNKKFNNENYLLKVIKKRPNEKIHNIVDELYNNNLATNNNKYINNIVMIGSLILVLIPFLRPFYIYQKNETGYQIKYYVPGLIGEKKVNIPSKHNGKDVTEIRGSAFINCYKIKEVIIPSTVKIIHGHAFENDTNLTTVVLPNDLEEIRGYTFNNDTKLVNINIPNKLKSIGGYAFANCKSLTNITLPNTLTEIRGHAFDGASSLVNIILPDSLETIGGGAFRDCTSLISITIPEKVTEIQGNTFTNCTSLVQVNLHDNITSIHGEVFMGCKSLKQIKLPSKIDEIRGSTFQDCSSLTEIDIPEGVTRIGGHAFHNCFSLSRVSFPDSLIEIGSSAFRNCTSLKTVQLPRRTIVNERAFKESPTIISYKDNATGDTYGYTR